MKRRAWKRWFGAAAAMGVLGACSSVPLYGNPVTSGSHPSPSNYFEVDWWTPLVEPVTLEYGPRELATPAVDPDSGRVITLTRDGFVRCVAPGGTLEWSFKTNNRFSAGASVVDGIAYVPAGDGFLYALEVRTGKLKWKYEAGEALATVPVKSGSLVLVASESDTLFAVKTDTGEWAWQYRRDPPSGFTIHGAGSPLVKDGSVYLGFSDGYLVALDADAGTEKWEKALSSGATQFLDVDSTPAIDESGRLFVTSYQGGLYALDAATGDVQWNYAVSGLTSVLAAGEVVIASGDGRLDAYLGDTGRLLWSMNLGELAGRAPVLARGMILLANQRALLFVDPRTGKSRLAWNPGDGISAPPRVLGSSAYVLSNNGYLYALHLRGGGG
ncbi:PQQ-binding-like beta-propeller repeat protein [Stigmatella sp. ncwal1]|uniref:PQQ-binding-like beta-propeller repeat protein n=1 Tax=Stigmatella ashevillensis TaxID=2995309 RepID=A0ABT5D1Q2_9BACT|nr:PQQ-binding-like beta-propeller repeat protein [Stigmatella ashevillena]MDC0707595.1 PQQ-binding-like beta-propeller repeat protein [Stigmatella ashevillena]